MNKSLRFTGLCVSSLVFVALIGYVFLIAAKAQPEEVKCPCEYAQTIPKTLSCWTETPPANPMYEEFKNDETGLTEECSLNVNLPDDPTTFLSVSTAESGNQSSPTCFALVDDRQACDSVFVVEIEMTPEEEKACQCELLAYVTSLNEVDGITVSGGPPYTCGDVDCRQLAPAPIPTINQWGLIAMAVVLGFIGIVGFMIIRRRKVSA